MIVELHPEKSRGRLLFVERDSRLRKHLEMFFTGSLGIKVEMVENALEGFHLLKRDKNFDGIIVGQLSTGVSELELYWELRNSDVRIPYMVYGQPEDKDLLDQIDRLEGVTFVPKSLPVRDFINEIYSFIGSEGRFD